VSSHLQLLAPLILIFNPPFLLADPPHFVDPLLTCFEVGLVSLGNPPPCITNPMFTCYEVELCSWRPSSLQSWSHAYLLQSRFVLMKTSIRFLLILKLTQEKQHKVQRSQRILS
jgi:hypothetical protein